MSRNQKTRRPGDELLGKDPEVDEGQDPRSDEEQPKDEVDDDVLHGALGALPVRGRHTAILSDTDSSVKGMPIHSKRSLV
jgi:hypothetical protein